MRGSTRTLFGAIVVCASSIMTVGGQPPIPVELSAALRAHLSAERFGSVTSLRGLPLGVRDELQTLFGGALDIAEPGADFQAADGNVNAAVPRRPHGAAGCSMDHCLVYYERGVPQAWRVVLFHWTPALTRLEWGGVAPPALTSFDAVRNAALTGAIKGPTTLW
jgi:hypothetical protein